MSSINDIPTPATYNGKPTHYDLFAGFNNAGIIGKSCYVATAAIGIMTGGILLAVPVLMEVNAWNKARHNRQDAQYAMTQQQANIVQVQSSAPVQQIALAPQMQQSPTHFQDMVAQQNLARYR